MLRLFFVLLFSVVTMSNAHAVTHWQGKQKALVLLVQWANVKSPHTQAEVDATFFQLQAPSLRQFFLENSMGKFDLTGSVLDWRVSQKKWNPQSACSNVSQIAQEGWNLFSKDIKISDYDSDGNGKIDNLFIVHSGRIGEDRVGPSCVFTSAPVADHAVVFQADGVGSVGTGIPIGFYIHEAGHGYFDLPDMYSDHYHGRYGIGMWGMMGLGAWGTNNNIPRDAIFRFPAHFDPASKTVIGWVKPLIVNQSQKSVKLRAVERSGDVVAIPTGRQGEYYYLEYRSEAGFSAGHLGHGLMIWRDFDIIQADGRDDINHGNNVGHRPLPPIGENFGDASDPFPGSLNVTSFKQGGVQVINIKQTSEFIEFDVQVSREISSMRLIKPRLPKWDGRERLLP